MTRAWDWLRQPMPAPPEALRRGPLRRDAFPSRSRSARLTSQLGIALAVAFGVCFLTGILSHLIQHPPGWFWWPSRPVWLYRVTQGIHVATGLAIFPILGVKLWSVYPRLFRWPPVRDAAHLLERLSIAVLVAAALFQLVTGLLNISLWYAPMPFAFIAAHHWTAWLVVGSILVHIGVKLPIVRSALGAPPRGRERAASPSRRQLLAGVAGASALITVATVGQTLSPLAAVSVLAPRRPTVGPQGLPVNKSARAARVETAALDPAYALVLTGAGDPRRLTLADLAALPQHTASLPITCVEGWSADGTWTGVRLRDLVALAGADPDRSVVFARSLQEGVGSVVATPHVRDPLTLVALRLNGEPLHLDHGYPCRLIAPNRPGVMQTKWLAALVVEPAR